MNAAFGFRALVFFFAIRSPLEDAQTVARAYHETGRPARPGYLSPGGTGPGASPAPVHHRSRKTQYLKARRRPHGTWTRYHGSGMPPRRWLSMVPRSDAK